MEEGESKGNILVVDDNPLIVDVIKTMLTPENIHVFTAESGSQAIEVLGRYTVDLIVCDIMMPKMNGFQLQDYLRSRAEFSHIPFVFLTALSSENDIERGRESGADDYVTKPFSPKELRAIIRGKLSRGQLLKKQTEEKYENYRKKVLHTLSHEFRTPLVAINTGTELLLEQGKLEKDKIKSLLQAVHRGGQRLERLVNDFMLLQQIEAGVAKRMYEANVKSMLVDTLFTDIQTYIQPMIRDACFSLSVKREATAASVHVYEAQILDIIGRIVANGIKFSRNEKLLELELSMEDNGLEIRIAVKDRGVGLNKERMREAVNLFSQLDREKMEQQGSGIGLAIASRYADLHGGRLDFEARVRDREDSGDGLGAGNGTVQNSTAQGAASGAGSIVSLILPIG